MRILSLTCAALLLCGFLSAIGQERKARVRPPVRFGGRLQPLNQLLMPYPEVQEELDLSPAQKEELKKIADDLQRQAAQSKKKADAAAAQVEDVETKNQIWSANSRANVIRAFEATPRMLKVLSRQQRVRLEQIQLQASLPYLFGSSAEFVGRKDGLEG